MKRSFKSAEENTQHAYIGGRGELRDIAIGVDSAETMRRGHTSLSNAVLSVDQPGDSDSDGRNVRRRVISSGQQHSIPPIWSWWPEDTPVLRNVGSSPIEQQAFESRSWQLPSINQILDFSGPRLRAQEAAEFLDLQSGSTLPMRAAASASGGLIGIFSGSRGGDLGFSASRSSVEGPRDRQSESRTQHIIYSNRTLPPPPRKDPLQAPDEPNAGLLQAQRRTAQNRMAQRAFRQRREQHISFVEERASLLERARSMLDGVKQRIKDIKKELKQLKAAQTQRKVSSTSSEEQSDSLSLKLDHFVPDGLKRQLREDLASVQEALREGRSTGGVKFSQDDAGWLNSSQ